MSFSENLMRLRKQKGLSQEEFANEIDVSRQTVSKWELGSSTPEMEKLIQMSNFFGVSVDDLLNSEDITSKTIKVENTSNQEDTINTSETNYNDYNNEPINSNENNKKKAVTIVIVTLIIGTIITILTLLVILLIRDFDEKENNKSSKNKINNTTSNVVENKIENTVENNTTNTIENNSISPSEFNASYHNGRIKGSTVEEDLSKLITNNKTNKKIIISVIYKEIGTSNADEITELKKSLDLDEYYEVSLEYDDEGYICTYVIEDAKKSPKDISDDVRRFNLVYNRGTWSGFHIKFALEKIITSNGEHPNKQIYVKYNEIETNNRDEIKSLKEKLGDHTEYDIEFEYDGEGYINKYIIMDK